MLKAKQLPSGNWYVRPYDGKEYKCITRPTEDEALFAALEFKLKKQEAKAEPLGITLGEAYDKYIASKEAILSPTTISNYKRMKKNYLEPLMTKNLKHLSQEMIQLEINNSCKTLSPKTIKNIHGLLSAVLKVYNPNFILRTTLPRKEKYIPHIPSKSDISSIMKVVAGEEIELPVLLALWLGLRMSEVRGIKWSNIKNGKLQITHALVDVDNEPVLKKTKTFAGKRVIPLPPYILELIKNTPKTSEHLINLTGRTIYERFSTLLEKNNIDHIRFHDLRHANASVMLSLNVPDKYAIERLGHETDNMVKNIYQHTMTEERKIVNDKINAYFEVILEETKEVNLE